MAEAALDRSLEPRVVKLEINGDVRHYATFSCAPLELLTLADLRPYPAMDATVWIDGVMEDINK